MRLTLAALILVSGAVPALAQETPADVAAILSSAQVYVEDTSAPVDVGALQSSIRQAGEYGLDLRVAVLAGSGDAEATASTVRSSLGEVTVVVFTADAYGVASAEVSSSRLQDALANAGDSLAGDSIENAVASLVAALEPADPFPWGALLLVGLVGVVVLAVGGRFWDSKARAERRARRIERRRNGLQERVAGISDEVLALSDHVELADSAILSTRYRDAVADMRTIEGDVDAAGSMHDLDEVEARIRAMEGRFASLRTEATAG